MQNIAPFYGNYFFTHGLKRHPSKFDVQTLSLKIAFEQRMNGHLSHPPP